MRTALYLRVSTDKQETDNQALQLREFAQKQTWQIVREYVDDGITGTKANRGALKQMFQDASQRKFDMLLFWALDRLSREGVLETLTYLRRLESFGIAYKSYTEQYLDSCGVFKDAVISLMATLAKQESIMRSERTKAGMARLKAAGKTFGRPRLPVEASKVARLRNQGLSGRAIARELGISEPSVRRLLNKGV